MHLPRFLCRWYHKNNIFHNAIDAVVVMDEDGVIRQWNPKAESIFGWSADEAIGQYFHELVIPEAQRSRRTFFISPLLNTLAQKIIIVGAGKILNAVGLQLNNARCNR